MVDGEKNRSAFLKGIENLTDYSTAHVAEWHIQNNHKLSWDKFLDEPSKFEYALYSIFGDFYRDVEEEVAMEIARAFNIDYNGENFVQLAKKLKETLGSA